MPPQLLPGVPGDALFFAQHAKQLSTKDNGVFLLDEIGSSDSLSMRGSAAASQSVGSATSQYVRTTDSLSYDNMSLVHDARAISTQCDTEHWRTP